jgi:hypothetical protein
MWRACSVSFRLHRPVPSDESLPPALRRAVVARDQARWVPRHRAQGRRAGAALQPFSHQPPSFGKQGAWQGGTCRLTMFSSGSFSRPLRFCMATRLPQSTTGDATTGPPSRAEAIRRLARGGTLRKGRAMKSLSAMLFVLIAFSGAIAQPRDEGAIMGPGMQSCAEFAQDFRRSPQMTETLHFVWAQGLMSGMNMMMLALKRPMHDLNGWSISDQQSHLRLYCEQRPLSDYPRAVQSLFEALPKIPPRPAR